MELPLEIIYEICNTIDNSLEKIELLKILNYNIPRYIWKEYFSDLLSGIFMRCFTCKRYFIQQEPYAGYDECSYCFYKYEYGYDSLSDDENNQHYKLYECSSK
jgi:hypothetical protein